MSRRPILVVAAIVVAAIAVIVVVVRRPFGRASPAPTTARAEVAPPTRRKHPVLHVVAARTASLDAPLQDAAAVSLARGRMALLGGLTAADTSTAAVRLLAHGATRTIATLPSPVHDAAAARLRGSIYLFGGGDGSRQHDEIVRLDPGGAEPRVVARLPAPSSDQAAATIGDTAYIVGGYTGTRWLDTVVAWRPGSAPRVVAHLPAPVRYAAVTSVGAVLVVAGGSLPDGTASGAVYVLRPGARPSRLGTLPAPTTHAAAAALAEQALVIGGRGASASSAVRRIVAIDPAKRTIRVVGALPQPLSDASAVSHGAGVLVAGGRSALRTTAGVIQLGVRNGTARRATHGSPPARTTNVYAADGPSMLTPLAHAALQRIYVPNSESNSVDVIDARTRKVVDRFAVGALPQHVTPSYDLKTLYVLNDVGNSITPIDPRTAKASAPIPVDDPYNMYFTPDGRYAIVVAERLHRLDFRDPHTFRLHHSLSVPCAGIDHMDFSADGSYLIASCEFSGQVLKVDVASERVVGTLQLPDGARGMPQDVKLSPDGRVFYVADMAANGLWELNGDKLRVIRFLRTGRGVHGLYPSRDARYLYATNRGEGSISVISFRTRKVVAKWRIPGGGSPDMGGVSGDGRILWLSGRYNAEVYAISTRGGRLLARIPVGSGPHGLCVWPQPGRYSLGHTGVLR